VRIRALRTLCLCASVVKQETGEKNHRGAETQRKTTAASEFGILFPTDLIQTRLVSTKCATKCPEKGEVESQRSSLPLNVDPGVDVRFAAEIPKHRRPFNLPDIPDPVVADVLVLIKGHVQVVEP